MRSSGPSRSRSVRRARRPQLAPEAAGNRARAHAANDATSSTATAQASPGSSRSAATGSPPTVTTDARGEAEVAWSAPPGVGATRNVGPCAGGVAAAVVIRPAQCHRGHCAAQQEPFTLCVSQSIAMRPASCALTRRGATRREDPRHYRAAARGMPSASHSVMLRSRDQRSSDVGVARCSARRHGERGDHGARERGAGGKWDVSVALPDGARGHACSARRSSSCPTVAAAAHREARRRTRQRPAASSTSKPQLTDGHGRGLPGAVSADRRRRVRRRERERLRARHAHAALQCHRRRRRALHRRHRARGIDRRRCDARCSGMPRRATRSGLRTILAHMRRRSWRRRSPSPALARGRRLRGDEEPADADRRASQGERSLGHEPRAAHARHRRHAEPPTTPGGEKLVLARPRRGRSAGHVRQRRAARDTTQALHGARCGARTCARDSSLDPDEPVFKDPNALLRRLVRDGTLARRSAPRSVGRHDPVRARERSARRRRSSGRIRGLRAARPGPDGLVGTGDDVRDPFERVVRSGSPYARAMQEDRIVDAKWDMVVADETVRAWQQLFEELTGRELGFGADGLGLTGVGEGGGGWGRASASAASAPSVTARERTRERGGLQRRRVLVRAGTHRCGGPRAPLDPARRAQRRRGASRSSACPTASGRHRRPQTSRANLPLSLRIDAGARWVEGDVVETHVLVRNRTDAAVHATIDASADGAAALEGKARCARVDVPAHGARTIRVEVRATGCRRRKARARRARARIARRRAPPYLGDGAGRRGTSAHADSMGRRRSRARARARHGYRSPVSLVSCSSGATTTRSRPRSSRSSRSSQKSAACLVDSLEGGLRIQRWATDEGHAAPSCARRDRRGVGRARALGRFNAYVKLDEKTPGGAWGQRLWALQLRARLLTKQPTPSTEKDPSEICPPDPRRPAPHRRAHP